MSKRRKSIEAPSMLTLQQLTNQGEVKPDMVVAAARAALEQSDLQYYFSGNTAATALRSVKNTISPEQLGMVLASAETRQARRRIYDHDSECLIQAAHEVMLDRGLEIAGIQLRPAPRMRNRR